MILHAHAECLRFRFQIPSDTSHTQYTQDFPLGIVTELWGRISAPGAGTEILKRSVEVTESTKEKKESCICCGGVDGCGDVGHEDVGGGAGGDVDLVVAGA